MSQIRVTKEFSFEMSHALEAYDGPCRNIHGHSYRLFVTVIGQPVNDDANPENGMVIDFGKLKKIVNKVIIDRYDHAFVIRHTEDNFGVMIHVKKHFDKVETVDYQPTCENMVSRFAEDIMKELPENVALYSLKLHETATSYAEWYASDNL